MIMKTRVLFVAAAAALSLMAQAQETYEIRKALVEGEKAQYKSETIVDMTMDASAMGGGSMAFTFKSGMTLNFVFGKVDKEKGAADFTCKVTDNFFNMEPDMSQGMMEVPKEFSFGGKMDSLFAMSDIKVEGLDGMGKQMMSATLSSLSSMVVFPKNKVKVGDTWKMPETMSTEFAEMTNDVTMKLEAVEKHMGADAFKVSIRGKVKSTSSSSSEGMNMKMVNDSDTDGTMFIDKATGRILSYTASGKTNMTMEMTDMGMTIPMTGSYTTKLTASDFKAETKGEKAADGTIK